MISFAWPWLFLVLPLPWLVRHTLPAAPPLTGSALRVPFFAEVKNMQGAGRSSVSRGSAEKWVLWLAWLCLVIAAARPQVIGEATVLPVSGRDLVLAVDISGSMEQPDYDMDGRRVTRLGVVKSVASRFIERREGDRIGLILFGARAYLQTPLTFDRDTVTVMLKEAVIGLAGKQTAIGDAIGLAVKRMRENAQRDRVLVLLTDGANTTGAMSPLRSAQLAASEGLRIYTIGIGADKVRVNTVLGTVVSRPSRDLDEDTLEAIARSTGGAYFRAGDTQRLEAIYQRLDELEPTLGDENVYRPIRSLYYWPLALALGISVWLAQRRVSRRAARTRSPTGSEVPG